MSLGAFSVGIPFKYDDRFKDDEYYVKRKYDTFKEEISEYNCINFHYKIYKNQVLIKAEQYNQSQMIKEMGIFKQNLISLILYTDYSELSAMFTATFRKNWTFEPLSMTKRRNSKFWWWSNILIRTVQFFGIEYGENGDGDLHGPFYTGMSVLLNMPSFNISLYSPTSTTIHQEVAIKFATEEGIIIEFQNDKIGKKAKAFDVSSISRYKEEDERYRI